MAEPAVTRASGRHQSDAERLAGLTEPKAADSARHRSPENLAQSGGSISGGTGITSASSNSAVGDHVPSMMMSA